MKENKKYRQLGWMIFGILAGGIALVFALAYLHDIVAFFKNLLHILSPIIIGIAVAYLMNPIVMILNGWLLELFSHTKLKTTTRKKLSKGIAIGVSLIAFMAIIIMLLYMVIPEVVDSLGVLVNNIGGYGTTFYEYISNLFEGNAEMQQQVQDILNNVLDGFVKWLNEDVLGQVTQLMSKVSVGIYGVFKAAINIVLGLCVAVYLLTSKQRFIGQMKKLLFASFKKETANVVLAVGRQADSIFGGFISGKLIDSLVIGVLCFIGCSIMKMPYLALISVVIGVTNIIPIFGPWIGAVPCTLLVLIIDPKKALIFAIFVLALQQFDGNILGPSILGDSTGLPTFWVVFAITLGGGLFKLPGMVLGVPCFAVIYFLIKTFIEFKLKEQNMSIQSDAYSQIKRIDPETMNSEYLNKNVSKRELRKMNVYQDDVTKEVAIAAKFSRIEREKREALNAQVLSEILNRESGKEQIISDIKEEISEEIAEETTKGNK